MNGDCASLVPINPSQVDQHINDGPAAFILIAPDLIILTSVLSVTFPLHYIAQIEVLVQTHYNRQLACSINETVTFSFTT